MNPLPLMFSTFVLYTSGYRIVCYYTNSAQNRTEIMAFKPSHVDPFMCTHLVYSHAEVRGLHLAPTQVNDETTPTTTGMYEEIVNLKNANPSLKILLAVGSFMEQPESFLAAASSDSRSAFFASSVTSYLRRRNFDGAQMEWANLAANQNPLYDKNTFLFLLKAIKKAFKDDSQKNRTMLILSVTLPAVKRHIDTGYKIPELVMEADFITIRSLDMRTSLDGKVGLNAPLRSDPRSIGDDRYLSVEWITKYYITMGAPKEKINIGIPTFGRSFQLKNEFMTTKGAAAESQKGADPWTARDRIVSYSEVCRLFLVSGSVEHDESQGGRYYTQGKLWISYEDIMSVFEKTCFMRELGLGGVTFWTLDLDDFTGEGCRHDSYPLIRTAVNLLADTDLYRCTKHSKQYVDVPPPLAATFATHVITPKDQKRIVCYYTNWAQYRNGKARFLPENINAHLCTHIVYTYAVLQDLTIVPFIQNDESKPWIEGMYSRVLRTKKQNPDLKVLLGVGGGSAGYGRLGPIISDTTMLEQLAKSIAVFLDERHFDGLEVTWQQPSSRWKPNFSYFIQILRASFTRHTIYRGLPGILLSVAMAAAKNDIDDGYGDEISRIAATVDFMSLMTYDFYGSWSEYTGHNSPLFSDPDDLIEDRYLSVDWVAQYYIGLGVPRHKIYIGIATYGRSFTLHASQNHGVRSLVKGPGQAGRFTATSGLLAFYEVCDFIADGANVSGVPSQRVSYAYNDTQWVGFDDINSVFEKACYVMDQDFGGVNVRTLDYDDFTGDFCQQGKYPLLTTIHMVLNSSGKEICHTFASRNGCSGIPASNSLLYIHPLFLWLVVSFCLT